MKSSFFDYYSYTNALFSKYGADDGNNVNIDLIHSLFSNYLQKKGFKNKQISTIHNARVTEININGKWYSTSLLSLGPPEWKLYLEENDSEMEVSEKLATIIIDFIKKNKHLFDTNKDIAFLLLEKIEKALSLLNEIQPLDEHRPTNYIRQNLETMMKNIKQNKVTLLPFFSHIIVDSWPMNDPLGNLLLEIQENYFVMLVLL